MLAQLRTQTKTILWIVVVGFVGYMFYGWGMNRLRPGGPEPGVVAKVYGQRVSWDEFRNEYRNQYQVYFEEQGQRPDAQAERQIAEQAWEGILQRRLLMREAEERRLTATEDEILMDMQTNPPPSIRAHPAFQTDSVFDQSKYLAALSDPSLDFSFLESYVRQTLPIRKVQDYIGSSVRITDEEARTLMNVLEQQVAITYANVDPLSHVREEIPEPSADQVMDYYTSHTEDFRIPEKRRLSYVEFPKEPGAEDEIFAREKIEEALDYITDGVPFEEIAPDYSDDQNSAPRGGDLGWLKPGQLPAILDSVAWGLEVGELSNVVKTEDGFHLIRTEEAREEDGIEERKISYILSRLEPSALTLEQLRVEAAELLEEAAGDDLEKAAVDGGYEFTPGEPYVQEQVMPFLAIPEDAAEDLFSGDLSALVGPVEGAQSFYAFQVNEILPSRIQPLEEIAEFVRHAYVQDQRKQKAKVIADQIAQDIRAGASLEQAAGARGVETEDTPMVTRINYIPGIGNDNIVAAAAFALGEGQTSGVLENADQFYIVRVDSMRRMDEQRFRDNVGGIKMSLLQTKQQSFLNDWYAHIKETAEIEDFRSVPGGY